MRPSKSKEKRARPVMFQGTSSHVGKSVLAAAVCRILARRGLRVAPFKAQNMALNSHVTASGGEIGVAQAFQAEAAGAEPTVDMNPVLLKPTGEAASQVVIHGRARGVMSAAEYHAFKAHARAFVLESYQRLSGEYDVIVMEGAGSPAEINLREGDIANMGAAELAGSPVVIIGDIDRGGVFASLVGTMELLAPSERARVRGFIINKFRGDPALLAPGLEMLTARTGVEVLGVVPYIGDVLLPDEDSVALEGRARGTGAPEGRAGAGVVRVAVVRLPRISNFTDFDPLRCEPGVEVVFAAEPAVLAGADLVIIPGSKNTIADLGWLTERGFAGAIEVHRRGGGMVAGVCGGFQMLGARLSDPLGVDSGAAGAAGVVDGLGMIDAETVMGSEKRTYRVAATALVPGTGERVDVRGYEIHTGETVVRGAPFSTLTRRGGEAVRLSDGAVSSDGLVWGTYIHGLFDNDRFRGLLLGLLRRRKGAEGAEGRPVAGVSFGAVRSGAMERLADVVEENLDVERLFGIIGLTTACGRAGAGLP